MNPTIPTKLGRYEVLEELGKGAMGIVYLARDPLIGRMVALKTFRLGFSASDQELDQFRSRFVREAQSAGILSHPNIVTIHDVVDEGPSGTCFIAMEYVKGTNLKQLLQRPEAFSKEFLVHIVAQIADGLDYAHSRGVVHRDIKPANILITPEEQVKITDFGIARLDSSNLTMEGQLLGTPNYMAPEQIQGKEVDHRADIFSLGVVFYEMLTRRKPFQGENLTVVTHKIVFEPFTPPEQIVTDLSPALSEVLKRCLEKDPNRRFSRASEVARALRRTLEARSESRDPDESPSTQEVLPIEQQKTRQISRAEMAEARAAGSPSSRGVQAAPPEAAPAQAAVVAPTRAEAPGVARQEAATAAPASAPLPAPAPGARTGPRVPTWLWIGGAGLAGLLLLGGVAFWIADMGSSPAPASGTAAPAAQTTQEQQNRLAVDEAIREVRIALGEDQLQRALQALARAELLDSQHPDLPILRQQIEQRSRELEEMVQIDRQVTEAMVGAREAFAKRRYDETVSRLRVVLELRPGLPEAERLLADAEQALERQRDRQRLAREAREALERPVVPAPTPAPSPVVSPVAPPAPPRDASLHIAFRCEIPEGVLTVYAGERQIVRESFRFVRRSGLLRSERVPGQLSFDQTLKPGPLTLRVYVSQPGKPTRAESLEVQIANGGKHALNIQVDEEGRLLARFE